MLEVIRVACVECQSQSCQCLGSFSAPMPAHESQQLGRSGYARRCAVPVDGRTEAALQPAVRWHRLRHHKSCMPDCQ